MPAASIGPLSRFPSSALFRAGDDPHGSSVRTRKLSSKPNYKPPKRLFMVYIRMKDGKLEVQYLEKYPIVWSKLRDEIDALFLIGSNGGGHFNAFDLMIFEMPSVFVVALDQPGWDFYYPDPTNADPKWPESHDPIVFIEKKAVLVKNDQDEWERTEFDFDKNRAFYDSQAFDIGRHGKAVACCNFITRNQDGDMLEYGKKQDFSFNIYLRVPFSLSGLDEKKITIILDPDGQNQGPNTL